MVERAIVAVKASGYGRSGASFDLWRRLSRRSMPLLEQCTSNDHTLSQLAHYGHPDHIDDAAVAERLRGR